MTYKRRNFNIVDLKSILSNFPNLEDIFNPSKKEQMFESIVNTLNLQRNPNKHNKMVNNSKNKKIITNMARFIINKRKKRLIA